MRTVPLFLALLPALAAALEINAATRAQLEQLPGLGVAMTERILQARGERPFADWDDLAARVPGIRGKRAEQLHRQGLTVNGRPLAAGQGKQR
jgi:competence protein ComEA